MRNNIRFHLCLAVLICAINQSVFAGDRLLSYPKLVDSLYQLRHNEPMWNTDEMRSALIRMLDSCVYDGLDKYKYHYLELLKADDSRSTDELYTDAALSYMQDLYMGSDIESSLAYNEISVHHTPSDTKYILSQLSVVHDPEALLSIMDNLVSTDNKYINLKTALREELIHDNKSKIKQLNFALNLERWIVHFNFQVYIVVNIAAAELHYYQKGEEKLNMKIVAGKPWTRTPRFAAYCNQVIFYPYWHVPRSIAVKEILPLCRKSPAALKRLDLQVVNANGTVINPYSISWKTMNASTFHYSFRQPTGCDNALGVIKFNLTDPFNVYMHDTNTKSIFSLNNRYYSHGCIRLEKPLDLADMLLDNHIDTAFLKACIKGQQPVINNLVSPVPVFVIYSTADADGEGNIVYYKDVYHIAQ